MSQVCSVNNCTEMTDITCPTYFGDFSVCNKHVGAVREELEMSLKELDKWQVKLMRKLKLVDA